MKLVPAQSGICGFEGVQQVKFLQFSDRGGVIMQGTELVVKATVCFAKGGVNTSTINSYPASVRMSVLMCGQSIVILNFLKEDYYV